MIFHYFNNITDHWYLRNKGLNELKYTFEEKKS